VSFQLQEELQCGRALALLVFRQLRLTYAHDFSEFCLGEVETSNLPNASADRLKIRLKIVLDHYAL